MSAIASVTPRVTLRAAISHVLILTRRNLMGLRHDPEQMAAMVLMPIMFLVLFVFVFGGALAGSTQAYLQFALPGVMTQGIVWSSMSTGAYLNLDISKGVFDRIRSLPIARSAPLIGQILGDTIRYGLGMAITLGFGMMLGFHVETGLPQTLAAAAVMVGFALAFCWIMILLGLLMKSPAGVQVAATLVVFPLTFASSIFVPTRTMPGWLQAWAGISPISLLSDTVRGLLVGGQVLEPGLKLLVWSVAVAVVFAPLSVTVYRRRV